MTLALIGFGEAARAFVAGGVGAATAFDNDTAKRQGIACIDDPAVAFQASTVVISLVTADQAQLAAEKYAPMLPAGSLYLDMNSVAPDTKRGACQVVTDAGGRYLDVAVMAPVEPAGLAVPLLVSGPDSMIGCDTLRNLGFTNVEAAGEDVGKASAIKMIRSVMIKGVEALTAEMMLAARAADVEAEVLASLGDGWADKADYNLERMRTHGVRRAAEMEESAKTLIALGIDPVMTRGTIIRQREMAV